jgi:hypothetical protein
MNKKEKLIIGLFSTLILLSFVNTTTAAPPSFIGVATGDEFTWVPSINMGNINSTGIALVGQDNWTLMYNMLLEYYENSTGTDFSAFAGSGVKLAVKNVSDEITVAPGIFAGLLTVDISVSQGNNNWTLMANNTMYPIYDPNSLNETTIVAAFGGIPLIMAKGTNYTMMSVGFTSIIASSPYTAGNITIQPQGNGLKITLKSSYFDALINTSSVPFELTLGDVVFNVRWNTNGVFEYGELVYGGLTLVSIQLTTSDSIPGFEIATIIGVSIVTVIAIIYIKRKKNL